MESKYKLTTFDNPFNPFVDFQKWYMFDCNNRYNTCSRLARIMNVDSEMTENEVVAEKERAMDFIVKYDLNGIFFKGTEEQIAAYLESKKNLVSETETNNDETESETEKNVH